MDFGDSIDKTNFLEYYTIVESTDTETTLVASGWSSLTASRTQTKKNKGSISIICTASLSKEGKHS